MPTTARMSTFELSTTARHVCCRFPTDLTHSFVFCRAFGVARKERTCGNAAACVRSRSHTRVGDGFVTHKSGPGDHGRWQQCLQRRFTTQRVRPSLAKQYALTEPTSENRLNVTWQSNCSMQPTAPRARIHVDQRAACQVRAVRSRTTLRLHGYKPPGLAPP